MLAKSLRLAGSVKGKEHAARSLVSWAKVLLGQVEPIHCVITLLIHKTTVSQVDPAGRNCILNEGWHTFSQVQIGTICSLAIMMRSRFTLGGRRKAKSYVYNNTAH